MGFGLMNGFIDHLYTRLGRTSNYNVIASFHNSQVTTEPSKIFPASDVLTSRSLAADFNSEKFLASRSQVLSSQPPVEN
jgi:hypothetical protein